MRISMRLAIVSLALSCTIAIHTKADQIRGSSSTFVYPIMSARSKAYPITATSFVPMYKHPRNEEHTSDLLAFFAWALEHGQEQAGALGYLPLPAQLVDQIGAYRQEGFR